MISESGRPLTENGQQLREITAGFAATAQGRDEDPDEEQRDQQRQQDRKGVPSCNHAGKHQYTEEDQSYSGEHESQQDRRAEERHDRAEALFEIEASRIQLMYCIVGALHPGSEPLSLEQPQVARRPGPRVGSPPRSCCCAHRFSASSGRTAA